MVGFFSENYEQIAGLQERLDKFSTADDIGNRLLSVLKAAVKLTLDDRAIYDEASASFKDEFRNSFLMAMRRDISHDSMKRMMYFFGVSVRRVTLGKGYRSDAEQFVLNFYLLKTDWVAETFDGYHLDIVLNGVPFEVVVEAQERAAISVGDLIKLRESIDSDLKEKRSEVLSDISSFVKNAELDVGKILKDGLTDAGEIEGRISGYRESLVKLSSEYNFVGISKAFDTLLKKKRVGWRCSICVVFLLGLLSVAFPVISIFRESFGFLPKLDGWGPPVIASLSAFVAAELLFIYFFRVALKSFLLVDDQVNDLQLRMSLCSFIEGYRDFAVVNNGDRGVDLSKFESLIFGRVPSHDSSLPGALDGVEYVSGIVSSIKNKPGN